MAQFVDNEVAQMYFVLSCSDEAWKIINYNDCTIFVKYRCSLDWALITVTV